MGKKKDKKMKVNIFGDGHLRVIGPVLADSPFIKLGYRMIIKKGTIAWFYQKLCHTYNRKPYWQWKTFCTAVIVVGTYDVLRYNNSPDQTLDQYLSKLKKMFKAFLRLLRERHKQLIILTIPPLSVFSDTQLRLMDMYNHHLKSLKDFKRVKVIDASEMFVRLMKSPGASQQEDVKAEEARDVKVEEARDVKAGVSREKNAGGTRAGKARSALDEFAGEAGIPEDPETVGLPDVFSEKYNRMGVANIVFMILREIKNEHC